MSAHHSGDPTCGLCETKLKAAHPFLASWFRQKKAKYPNVHISWAFRDQPDQEQAYRDGKTHLHWPKSAHNQIPALALDLFQIDEDGVGRWSPSFFLKLSQENEEDKLPIFWGGKWKSFGDGDHYEYQIQPEKEIENPAPSS